MIDIKKILCPIDFSEPSLVALSTARGLAARFGAELHLMHCVEPIPVPAGPTTQIGMPAETLDVTSYQKHMLQRAREDLEKLSSEHSTDDTPVRIHLAEGKPQNEIVACAGDIGADLMVISSHGTSGLRRFIFGSVADKIVRTSPCPVLTMTPEATD
ncbi:universal stress protein [bacterium]|nr:universal stress protein [bacterium]